MRNISAIIFASSSLLLSSCASLGGNFGSTSGLPSTLGESSANYGYIPLDALPINQVSTADSCKEQAAPYPFVPVLEALPDLSVRFAVAELKANGGLEFGPSKVTTENSTYRAVLYGESSGADAIIKTPRVVGLYSPVGSDPRMINAI